ncbi:MAG: type II toxin-antitoxin system Phd/YefM family antitoxin [Panacagrimonas sp.]
MTVINILEAKTSLSRLVAAVESGQEKEIVIARNGRPVARLVPLNPVPGVRLGLRDGKFAIPEDWDEHHAEVAALFGAST